MSNLIKGQEFPINKIFTSDFEYHIPPYQRPYAWTEEETATLFDDLFDFFTNQSLDENYFLGSLVLVKEENRPQSDVIDGQQRLTTLTILLAVCASLFDGKQRQELMEFVCEPGKEFLGITPRPRLYLRDKDKKFFENYIQNLNFEDLFKLDLEQQDDEAKQHIIKNAKLLKARFTKHFDDKSLLSQFIMFVLTRCYLIVVSTPSKASAFRVFSVMNSRGLDLLPIDIIKADIIGKIAIEKQDEYTDKWEELEAACGRKGFNELFMHIRTIYAKQKAQNTLLEEFKTHVLPNVKSEISFIEDVVEPYAEAYNVLSGCSYQSVQDASTINSLLKWLNKVDNYDWYPAAIKFLAEHSNEPEYVLWFFKKLERLASYLLITSADINARIKRYSKLLSEMDEAPDHSISSPLKSIELTASEILLELQVLQSDIYLMTGKRRNFILLRLDSIVSDNSATYDTKVLTIEHVLPQTVKGDSLWAEWWPDEDLQKKWRNKLANLVPLARRINSAAQNFDFEDKKQKYFMTSAGTSSYVLTTQVLAESKWTPEVVEKRQEHIINKLVEYWELNPEGAIDDTEETKGASPRPQLDFIELGLNIGDKLVFTHDSSVIVTIVSNKKVLYQGAEWSLSPLAKMLKNYSYYVNPGSFWKTMDGKSIGELYDKRYPLTGK